MVTEQEGNYCRQLMPKILEPVQDLASLSEKALICENRSAAYFWVREQRIAENQRIVTSIVEIFNRLLKVASVVACVGWSLMAASTELNSNTLSTEARSSNVSELFSKVLELEENMRELTGKLQTTEHEQKNLVNKFNEAIKAKDEASRHNQSIERPNADTQSPSLDKGEILYRQGLAASNNKLYNQAATYFAKSYRYYSDVKSNEVLFKLIEVLALEKKYEQACTLTKKVSDKNLKTEQKSYLTELISTHCQKKPQE